MLVVVPADRTVKLDTIVKVMVEPYEVTLKTTVEALLKDCKPGAIPPLSHAYGANASR
jgi:prolyl-tRNA editing enzyme YbaK/EbsC (Cys-tRNA(Pro) deacylase)